MFVLKHILWIIVTLYIHALLPLVCNATAEIKDNWMEEDGNIDRRIHLKLRRRLLYSDNYNSSSGDFIFYFVAMFFIAVVAFYVKCCIEMSRNTVDEDRTHFTQHPPPACRITDISAGSARPRYSARLPSGSRPLAPPRTSTSVILLPEERQFDPFFIGISNPLFNTLISNEQVQRDVNTSISNEQEQRDVTTSISNEQVRRDVTTSISNEQVRRDINTSISNEQVRRDVNPTAFIEQIRREFNIPISDDRERRYANTSISTAQIRRDLNFLVFDDQERRDVNTSISNEQVRRDIHTSISNEQVRRDINTSISNEQVRRDVNPTTFIEQIRREFNIPISDDREQRDDNTSIFTAQIRRDFNFPIFDDQERRDVNTSIFTEHVRRDFNISLSDDQERRDGYPLQNPTDMPPNYESVVKDDEKCTVYNIQDGCPYDEPPPKYSEF